MPEFVDDGGNDFMSRSAALRNHGRTRAAFDPRNEKHVASLKHYLETGSWGDVMFFLEHPFTDVPTYVLTQYTSFMLGAKRETPAEKAVRESKKVVKPEVLDLANFEVRTNRTANVE